jgi:hypothetical protein
MNIAFLLTMESELNGILPHADVVEEQKLAFCLFELPDRRNSLATIGLTEAELNAYRKHHDTFFGQYDPRPKKPMTDPLDLYDWLYKTNGDATKEQLIESMKDAPVFKQLKDLSREELLSIRCERSVYGIMQASPIFQPKQDA